MEYQENALAKSARRWVLALSIIYTIGVIVSVVGFITLINLKMTDYASLHSLGAAGEELIEIYKAQSGTLNLIIQGLLIVGQLVAVILLFRGASSIKKGLSMDNTPFYLLFGLLIFSNIFNLTINGGEFSIIPVITIVISLLFIAVPFWKVSKLNRMEEENRG